MTALDYTLLAGYMALVLFLGLALARRRSSFADFALAERSLSWFPLGISVMLTVFSAVNIIAFSGEILGNGLYVLMALPAFPIVAWPLIRKIIPFFVRSRGVSAYEFLEARFDVRTRRLASVLFIFWRLVWMATVLYATSRFAAGVTGINYVVLAAVTAVVATVYTMAGGMRAVVWTDLAQFVVLAVGLLCAVVFAANRLDGLNVFAMSGSYDGLLKPFRPFDPAVLSLNPKIRMTLWSCIIGSVVAFAARYGADQMVVQRFLGARSEKDAVRGFKVNIAVAVLSLVLLSGLGLMIRALSIAGDIQVDANAKPVERLASFFVVLPSGLKGLLMAGLLASTMSSLDSGLHSCCTAMVTDFGFGVRGRNATAVTGVKTQRILIAIAGCATAVMALLVGRLGTVFEIANKAVNGFGGAILALCIMGWAGRGATPRGVFLGGIAGALWSAWVSLFVKGLALHYYAVVNLAGALGACYAFSIIDRLTAQKMNS